LKIADLTAEITALYKSVTILYIVCFATYILFTRQPDFFDGEKAPAVIHWLTDSTGQKIPKAVFSEAGLVHSIDARYFLRDLPEGKQVEVIYENGKPGHAAVYAFFGYWMSWGELAATVLIYIALFQIAVAVTKNPTPDSLIEQLEYKEEKKKKYLE
jgi:hypothetical protein